MCLHKILPINMFGQNFLLAPLPLAPIRPPSGARDSDNFRTSGRRRSRNKLHIGMLDGSEVVDLLREQFMYVAGQAGVQGGGHVAEDGRPGQE